MGKERKKLLPKIEEITGGKAHVNTWNKLIGKFKMETGDVISIRWQVME